MFSNLVPFSQTATYHPTPPTPRPDLWISLCLVSASLAKVWEALLMPLLVVTFLPRDTLLRWCHPHFHLASVARHNWILLMYGFIIWLPADISSLRGYSGSPASGGGVAGLPGYSAAAGSERTPGSANNDQTLKSLQKHYMNAITSLNPSLPTQVWGYYIKHINLISAFKGVHWKGGGCRRGFRG